MGNPFTAYAPADLFVVRDQYRAAVAALAGGKSYSIAGRNLTRSDEDFVLDTLGKIEQAIQIAAGTASGARVSYPDFRDA